MDGWIDGLHFGFVKFFLGSYVCPEREQRYLLTLLMIP